MSGRKVRWTEKQKDALRFEANQCLLAGAGSGKTLTLVELVLRLLAGEINGFDEGLELGRILALTYTEKAAREMKDRLRLAMNDKIKSGDSPGREFWMTQRRFLDRAQISTIHSFCLSILRQHGFEAGLDPDFSVLDNDRDFRADTFRDTLLNWLQQNNEDFTGLLGFFPWLSRGYGHGLDRLLEMVIARRRTYGRRPCPADDAFCSVKEAAGGLRAAADLASELRASGKLKPDKDYSRIIDRFIEVVGEVIGPETSEDEILAALSRLENSVTGNWYAGKPAKDLAVEALKLLNAENDRRKARPLLEAILLLAEKLEETWDKAKERRRVMDFDDLLLETRRLLAQNPSVRNSIKEKYRVLLVDEFQDTNRLQADIIAYLLEPSDSCVILAPEEPALDLLERSPRKLVIFGDPKQSIYRFRGAEVGVFQRLKDSLTGAEGENGLISLDSNFRSQKRLVDFFNAFFSETMTGNEDYSARYGGEDRQRWSRPDTGKGPAVEILLCTPDSAEEETRRPEAEIRRLEAEQMAARLREIFRDGAPVKVGDEARKAEPGDVAVLLRRFTHLSAYETAFRQAGVPFYTVRGRGFYQAAEVWDLINLMIFLANPAHGPALLGLLRSPLFGLTDDTLTRLVWPDPTGPMLLADYFLQKVDVWPAGLEGEQLDAARRANRIIHRLGQEAGRSFPAELLEQAIEATDYLAVLSAQPEADQKVANVRRFVETARTLPAEALYAPGELARYLERRIQDTKDDSEAQTTMEGAPAVQIMTIHQAKGLEFPIVCVPDAGEGWSRRGQSLLFGDDDSAALSFKDPETGKRCEPPGYSILKQEDEKREQAEYARLFYVAATRARDHLLVSGNFKKKEDQESWLARLMTFSVKHPEMVGLLRPENPAETSVSAQKTPELHELPQPGAEAEKIAARALLAAPHRPVLTAMTVTDLSQYLICPRRYYLERVLGMPPQASGDGEETASLSLPEEGLTPREKGLVLHHILETVDLAQPPDQGELSEAGRVKLEREGWKAAPGQLEDLGRLGFEFLNSPWGTELRKAHQAGRWSARELPVLLKIEAGEGESSLILTGEIDLAYVTAAGRPRLLDYKYAARAKVGRYEAQLKCYALALMKTGLTAEMEAALYFTNENQNSRVDIPLPGGWENGFQDLLRRVAQELPHIIGPEGYEPAKPHECPDPGCPLKYACP